MTGIGTGGREVVNELHAQRATCDAQLTDIEREDARARSAAVLHPATGGLHSAF